MKICDRCKRNAQVLHDINREFSGGGLQVCDTCDAELYTRLDVIDKEIKVIKKRRRREAFVIWYGSEPQKPEPRWWQRLFRLQGQRYE